MQVGLDAVGADEFYAMLVIEEERNRPERENMAEKGSSRTTTNKAVLRPNRGMALRSEPLSEIARLADADGLASKRDHIYAAPVDTARDRKPGEWAGTLTVESNSSGHDVGAGKLSRQYFT